MPEIYYIVYAAIIIACISAFFILFISRIGLRDRFIERSPKLISKMFGCDFCLSFWTGLFISIVFAIFTQDILLIGLPIMTTPITRILL